MICAKMFSVTARVEVRSKISFEFQVSKFQVEAHRPGPTDRKLETRNFWSLTPLFDEFCETRSLKSKIYRQRRPDIAENRQ
jgi:hypothetical protein